MRLPTRLSRRAPESSKFDFGHLLILAGSARFSGAAVLAADAAMRSGAGLVTLGTPKSLNSAVIKIKSREVMTLPLPQTRGGALSYSGYKLIKSFIERVDCLALGPGLSTEASTQRLVRKLVSGLRLPVVIDADALNALVGHTDILHKAAKANATMILTPHPGEMGRLLGVSSKKVQQNRLRLAKKFARDYGVILVLKGKDTVVAGGQAKSYINHTGNSGMATAGSGDVLSGMIAAFLGQGMDGFSAAKFAVYLHGVAADLAVKEMTRISLIASDIIDKIPKALKRCD